MTTRVSVGEIKRRGLSVATVATLRSINLSRLNCESAFPLRSGALSVNSQLSFGVKKEIGFFVVASKYVLVAQNEASESAWKLELELLGAWDLTEEVSTDFSLMDYNCFALASGVMTLHPFARETIHNITSRSGYPPMTMDILISPLARPEDEFVEFEPNEDSIDSDRDI